MFEKFSEVARRSIFMARYEASVSGSGHIESEHLLLGILRMDKDLATRVRLAEKAETIRKQIEQRYAGREKISTSMDLPLSKDVRQIVHHAIEEMKRRGQNHIGNEHLLLGLLLVEKCPGAEILRENQVTREELAAEVDRSPEPGTTFSSISPWPPPAPEPLSEPAHESSRPEVLRNLSEAARNGTLGPLIGREREVQRIIHILSRRTRNNPLLVGEPGVGKTAILEGVAQKIANSEVPFTPPDRAVFAVDASSLISPSRRGKSGELGGKLIVQLASQPIGILCVDGLLDLAASPGWGAIEATHVLEVLARSGIQCIATGTPAGLRRAFENAGILVRHFEVVEVAPPSEEEAVAILAGLKPQYEKFHGVVFGEGVIEAAVYASGRFLPHRHLPDRALDLLDEAGARAKVRRGPTPREEIEAQRRLREIHRQMENAITLHEHDRAQELAEQEKQQRETLRTLYEARELAKQTAASIAAADLEEAIAERAGVTVAAVQEVLKQKKGKESQRIAQKLAGAVPVDQAWLPLLASYLAGCSAEEADRLSQAIKAGVGG